MLFKDNFLSSSNGNLPHSDQVVSVAGKESLGGKKRNKWNVIFDLSETLHFKYLEPLIFAGLSPVVIRV